MKRKIIGVIMFLIFFLGLGILLSTPQSPTSITGRITVPNDTINNLTVPDEPVFEEELNDSLLNPPVEEPVVNETIEQPVTEPVVNETVEEPVVNETPQDPVEEPLPPQQDQPPNQEIINAIDTKIKQHSNSDRVEIVSAVDNNLQVEFDSLEGKKAEIMINGLSDTEAINFIQAVSAPEKVTVNAKDINMKTEILAINSIDITNADIKLPKSGDVNVILECSDSNWDSVSGSCSDWHDSGLSYTQDNDYVYFTVNHFSAVAGGEDNSSDDGGIGIEGDIGVQASCGFTCDEGNVDSVCNITSEKYAPTDGCIFNGTGTLRILSGGIVGADVAGRSIILNFTTINLSGGNISTRASSGNTGAVTIYADSFFVDSSSSIYTYGLDIANQSGGNVVIRANAVDIRGPVITSGRARKHPLNNHYGHFTSGTLYIADASTVNITGTITLSGVDIVVGAIFVAGCGADGGNLFINASEWIYLSTGTTINVKGSNYNANSIAPSPGHWGGGYSGDVTLLAKNITVMDAINAVGGIVNTPPQAYLYIGEGGDVNIFAQENLILANVYANSGHATVSGTGAHTATYYGNGGDIFIEGSDVTLIGSLYHTYKRTISAGVNPTPANPGTSGTATINFTNTLTIDSAANFKTIEAGVRLADGWGIIDGDCRSFDGNSNNLIMNGDLTCTHPGGILDLVNVSFEDDIRVTFTVDPEFNVDDTFILDTNYLSDNVAKLNASTIIQILGDVTGTYDLTTDHLNVTASMPLSGVSAIEAGNVTITGTLSGTALDMNIQDNLRIINGGSLTNISSITATTAEFGDAYIDSDTGWILDPDEVNITGYTYINAYNGGFTMEGPPGSSFNVLSGAQLFIGNLTYGNQAIFNFSTINIWGNITSDTTRPIDSGHWNGELLFYSDNLSVYSTGKVASKFSHIWGGDDGTGIRGNPSSNITINANDVWIDGTVSTADGGYCWAGWYPSYTDVTEGGKIEIIAYDNVSVSGSISAIGNNISCLDPTGATDRAYGGWGGKVILNATNNIYVSGLVQSKGGFAVIPSLLYVSEVHGGAGKYVLLKADNITFGGSGRVYSDGGDAENDYEFMTTCRGGNADIVDILADDTIIFSSSSQLSAVGGSRINSAEFCYRGAGGNISINATSISLDASLSTIAGVGTGSGVNGNSYINFYNDMDIVGSPVFYPGYPYIEKNGKCGSVDGNPDDNRLYLDYPLNCSLTGQHSYYNVTLTNSPYINGSSLDMDVSGNLTLNATISSISELNATGLIPLTPTSDLSGTAWTLRGGDIEVTDNPTLTGLSTINGRSLNLSGSTTITGSAMNITLTDFLIVPYGATLEGIASIDPDEVVINGTLTFDTDGAVLSGGNITVINGTITSDNNQKDFFVNASDTLLINSGGSLYNCPGGTSALSGGDIHAKAQNMTVYGYIYSCGEPCETVGTGCTSGTSGIVNLTASNMDLKTSADIEAKGLDLSSSENTVKGGFGNTVYLSSPILNFSGFIRTAGGYATATAGGKKKLGGDAGDVIINSADLFMSGTIYMFGGYSKTAATTYDGYGGKGGNLNITSTNITTNDDVIIYTRGGRVIPYGGATMYLGNGGNITISASTIELNGIIETQGGKFEGSFGYDNTPTDGYGDGGDIRIISTNFTSENLTMNLSGRRDHTDPGCTEYCYGGDGGDLYLETDFLNMSGTSIESSGGDIYAYGTGDTGYGGNGGVINITAGYTGSATYGFYGYSNSIKALNGTALDGVGAGDPLLYNGLEGEIHIYRECGVDNLTYDPAASFYSSGDFGDADGWYFSCDNCESVTNVDQADIYEVNHGGAADGVGDVCDLHINYTIENQTDLIVDLDDFNPPVTIFTAAYLDSDESTLIFTKINITVDQVDEVQGTGGPRNLTKNFTNLNAVGQYPTEISYTGGPGILQNPNPSTTFDITVDDADVVLTLSEPIYIPDQVIKFWAQVNFSNGTPGYIGPNLYWYVDGISKNDLDLNSSGGLYIPSAANAPEVGWHNFSVRWETSEGIIAENITPFLVSVTTYFDQKSVVSPEGTLETDKMVDVDRGIVNLTATWYNATGGPIAGNWDFTINDGVTDIVKNCYGVQTCYVDYTLGPSNELEEGAFVVDIFVINETSGYENHSDSFNLNITNITIAGSIPQLRYLPSDTITVSGGSGSVIYPSAGSGGTTLPQINIVDNIDVNVDGALDGTELTSAGGSYSYDINPPPQNHGLHTIFLNYSDTYGIYGYSPIIEFEILRPTQIIYTQQQTNSMQRMTVYANYSNASDNIAATAEIFNISIFRVSNPASRANQTYVPGVFEITKSFFLDAGALTNVGGMHNVTIHAENYAGYYEPKTVSFLTYFETNTTDGQLRKHDKTINDKASEEYNTTVRIDVNNTGTGDMNNTIIYLSAADSGFSSNNPVQTCDDLAHDESCSLTFNITIDATIDKGTYQITFAGDYTNAGGQTIIAGDLGELEDKITNINIVGFSVLEADDSFSITAYHGSTAQNISFVNSTGSEVVEDINITLVPGTINSSLLDIDPIGLFDLCYPVGCGLSKPWLNITHTATIPLYYQYGTYEGYFNITSPNVSYDVITNVTLIIPYNGSWTRSPEFAFVEDGLAEFAGLTYPLINITVNNTGNSDKNYTIDYGKNATLIIFTGAGNPDWLFVERGTTGILELFYKAQTEAHNYTFEINISNITSTPERYTTIVNLSILDLPPEISDIDAMHVPGVVGQQQYINYSADDDQNELDHTWIVVQYPNATTEEFHDYTAFGTDYFKFNFLIPEEGDYNVTVYANDSGNKIGNGTFGFYATALYQLNGTLNNVTSLNALLNFTDRSTGEVLYSFNITSSDFDFNIAKLDYDLFIRLFDDGVIVFETTLYDIDKNSWVDDFLRLEEIPTYPRINENIVTNAGYGIETNLSYSNATVAFPFDAGSYTESYERLAILRCENFTVYGADCHDGNWVSISRNITSTRITANTYNFSGFIFGDDETEGAGEPGPTTPTARSSGGGGGGSSGVSKQELQIELNKTKAEILEKLAGFKDVRIDTTEISRNLFPSDSTEVVVNVFNDRSTEIIADISLEGRANTVAEVTPASRTIPPRATESFTLLIDIPEAEPAAVKYGNLFVTIDDQTEKIPVAIRILEAALEPRLSLKSITRSVTPGEVFKLQADVTNPGNELRTFSLTFEIRDSLTNEKMMELNKKYILADNLVDVVEFFIPRNQSVGEYFAKAVLTYTHQGKIKTLSVSEPFTLEKPLTKRLKAFAFRRVWFFRTWHLFVFAVLIAAMLVGVRSLEQYIESQKKYQNIEVDAKLLPHPGPRTAFIGKIAETHIRTFIEMEKLTTHTIIAGATGSGKTVAAQGIIEEALDHNIAVVVFDPTGQWSGYLRPCVDKKWLKLYAQFGMHKGDAKAYKGNIFTIKNPREYIDLKASFKAGTINVFMIHKIDPKDLDVFISNTVRQIFKMNLPEAPILKTMIVYDEVHRLLPKFGGSGAGFIQIERACREFRKWGVGVMLVSQVLSDFVGEIKANISTEIQMRTRAEGDLDRVKSKYGDVMLHSLVKASVGTGMLQNAEYNKGRPYLVSFRPLKHNITRLTDKDLELYDKYNNSIDDIKYQIEQLKELKQDTFDIELELKLASDKLMEGKFSMVDIYVEGLNSKLKMMWSKAGKTPKKRELKLISEEEIKLDIEIAKRERERYMADMMKKHGAGFQAHMEVGKEATMEGAAPKEEAKPVDPKIKKLSDHIKTQLKKGLSKDKITASLKKVKWKDNQIQEAFKLAEQKPAPPPKAAAPAAQAKPAEAAPAEAAPAQPAETAPAEAAPAQPAETAPATEAAPAAPAAAPAKPAAPAKAEDFIGELKKSFDDLQKKIKAKKAKGDNTMKIELATATLPGDVKLALAGKNQEKAKKLLEKINEVKSKHNL
ncbi:helicase HerA-like domain-containing protein [Nanoarchaeota archaeon]